MNKIGIVVEGVRSGARGFVEGLPKPVRAVLSWLLNQIFGSAKF
jgi:hypothetical protein